MALPIEFDYARRSLYYRQTARTFRAVVPCGGYIDENTEFIREQERRGGLPELDKKYKAVYVFKDTEIDSHASLIRAHAASNGWILAKCYFLPICAGVSKMLYWFYI